MQQKKGFHLGMRYVTDIHPLTALQIEILGREQAVILGCKGVELYNEDNIVLAGSREKCSLWGAKMVMESFSSDGVRVTGEIQRLELSAL